MRELIKPTIERRDAWLAAHEDWGPGLHEDGFGLLPADDVLSPEGFAAWLDRLAQEEAGSSTFRCLCRWIVDGDAVAGGIALRIGDHSFVDFAGHIGYGIRPSMRRRGLATWALAQVLDLAADNGLDRVLLVCESDNTASVATIERNGGVLERSETSDEGTVSRYWITVPARLS